jgi:phospholipid/cholesterol/gamma-HCH transport system permease protein
MLNNKNDNIGLNCFFSWISSIISGIGRMAIKMIEKIGSIFIFIFYSIYSCFDFKNFYSKQLFTQCVVVGYFSIPVVALTAIFTGAVLALQSYSGFSRFSAEGAIPTVVVLSITRELAPVMAGLMVAGRVGAAIAAEIGTMKVTEQIDALITLSTKPFNYLVVPRLIALTITLPLLVVIADIIGVFGGYFVSTTILGFGEISYIKNTFQYLENIDVISGIIKSAVFGFIIAIGGCYNGFNCGKGAQGVGFATTSSVVSASIFILCSNYFLTQILFSK